MKSYPTEIIVRISSDDTLKAIAAPCAVVPLHWPTLSDEDVDGAVGVLPHAVAIVLKPTATSRSIPTTIALPGVSMELGTSYPVDRLVCHPKLGGAGP